MKNISHTQCALLLPCSNFIPLSELQDEHVNRAVNCTHHIVSASCHPIQSNVYQPGQGPAQTFPNNPALSRVSISSPSQSSLCCNPRSVGPAMLKHPRTPPRPLKLCLSISLRFAHMLLKWRVPFARTPLSILIAGSTDIRCFWGRRGEGLAVYSDGDMCFFCSFAATATN
jgi:hypothetical protein